MFSTLFSLFTQFQSPATAKGKSIRDAILAGLTAVFVSLSEGSFGPEWTPIITSISMFALAQLNRINRSTNNEQ